MRDYLLSLAADQTDPHARLNLVRDYLQALILRSLQEAGAFAALAFQGGTALRFLHGLRRFSEDLDFSLERPEHDRGLEAMMKALRGSLEAAGHDMEIAIRAKRTVHAALVRFPGLLYETGLAPTRSAKLMIRVEVDTQPPSGAILETRMVTRFFPIGFRAYDLSSCMSGKIHALFARGHPKGRDLFDLAWYLTRSERPSPNLELLRNALAQTGWEGPDVDERSWRRILVERVSSLVWDAVVRDVEPFLEDPGDRSLLDRELLIAELERGGS